MDSKLVSKPNIIAPVMAGRPQMTVAFLADMTKMLGTSIVALQDKQPQQHQMGSTHSGQKNMRENYNDYMLASIMGYVNVFNTSDIPMIWGKFQQSKELAYNRQ